MKEKILVLEDEIGIRSFVSINLKREGYEIIEAGTGAEAIEKINENNDISIALLDVMLPDMSGIEVCKYIRQKFDQVGIIMLTAKTEIEDVLDGLEIGADDYMKKPFDPRELVLRIKKFLKTTDREIKNERYRFKDIEIDESRHIVIANGEEVELSKKEYDLLLLLVKNKDLVITRERILDKVWNSNYYTGDRTVDVYISKLRDKIPELSECIKTVKGVGYKLEEKR